MYRTEFDDSFYIIIVLNWATKQTIIIMTIPRFYLFEYYTEKSFYRGVFIREIRKTSDPNISISTKDINMPIATALELVVIDENKIKIFSTIMSTMTPYSTIVKSSIVL